MSDRFDITRTVIAAVHHWHDDDRGEAFCLQIELGNDYGITLSVSEKEPPSVNLWHGNGEHSFTRSEHWHGETIASFREFVAAAFEPQPPPEAGL